MKKREIIYISNYISPKWQKRISRIRLILILLCAAAVGAICFGMPEKKEEVENHLLYQAYLEAAQKAQEEENFYEAELNYRKMLALSFQDETAYDGIAKVLEKTRNYQAALEIRKEQAELSQNEEIRKEQAELSQNEEIQKEITRLEEKIKELEQTKFTLQD